MHDVAPWLVPVADDPIPLGQHESFLRHMATLHAAFWNCGSECEVVPAMHRYLELSPWLAEAGRGRAGRGGRRAAARARPGAAGDRAGTYAIDLRAQQLETRQPGYRCARPDGPAGMGAARAPRGDGLPGRVAADPPAPSAANQGSVDGRLPCRAGSLRCGHRAVVGPAAG